MDGWQRAGLVVASCQCIHLHWRRWKGACSCSASACENGVLHVRPLVRDSSHPPVSDAAISRNRQMVGTILWIMNTRPDACYAATQLAREKKTKSRSRSPRGPPKQMPQLMAACDRASATICTCGIRCSIALVTTNSSISLPAESWSTLTVHHTCELAATSPPAR